MVEMDGMYGMAEVDVMVEMDGMDGMVEMNGMIGWDRVACV